MATTRASIGQHVDNLASDSATGYPYKSDALALAVITFLSYLALIWQFPGPTYLMDEIGYLANAATLSGRSIDAGSSYYLGYSLFLLPGFVLFEQPALIWKSVLVTNSLLFAISVFLLHRMSGLFSDNRRLRIIAVFLCALYPAYPTMAGYAYSTPGIVVVYVAACWALCRAAAAPKTGLMVFALLVGFLNWMHPTGLPIAVAALMCLAVMGWLDRKLVPMIVVSAVIIVLMILVFRMILNPLLLDMMTPEGFEPRLHYSSAADQLKPLFTLGGAVEFVTRFLAQIGIVLIASLAVASAGAVHIFNRLALVGNAQTRDTADRIAFLAFILLSLLGVAALTAVIFTKPSIYYNNYWVHGRYIDGVLAPFLLVSLLISRPRLQRLMVTLIVLVPLLALYWAIGQEFGFTDEVELPSFWPQTAFPLEPVGVWFLSGAVACVIALFLPGPVVKGILVGLFVYCISNQVSWHHQSFRASANPTDLHRFVGDHNKVGSCVAFSPSGRDDIGNRPYERFNQLSFYLMNYAYRRMTLADWAENCNGPYLTYDDESAFAGVGAVRVAQGLDTGLRVYAKDVPTEASHETYRRIFIRTADDDGAVSYIARVNAEDLRGRIGTGILVDDIIKTTGSEGHLFYGPYGLLEAGKLRVTVYGRASKVDGSKVDLVTDGGKTVHGAFPLQLSGSADGVLASGAVDLPEALQNFELRMYVGSDADIEFSHYDLEMVPD